MINTQEDTTVIRPKRSRRRPNSFVRTVTIGAVAIGGVGTLAIAVATVGMVVGEEFSPDLFARRSFVYYRIPVLGTQISPVYRSDTTNSLEKHLSAAGLIPKTTGAPPRWDVVVVLRSGVSRWTGNAQILCNYLDQSDDNGSPQWLNWSKTNTELAEVLWPKIAELARQQLYFLCPDLLELAAAADDSGRLDSTLRSELAGDLLWLADRQRKLGRHSAAITLYSQAATLQSDLPEVFRGRGLSYRALGKAKEAAADLQRARQLGLATTTDL